MSEPKAGQATAGRTPRVALQEPVTDVEPEFLSSLPMDNAVGAIVALTAEVYMLRERLGALEAELASQKVLPAGAVENHVDTPQQAQARAAELTAYTQRVLSELTRDRVPVAKIDPDVEKYLRPTR